MSNRIPLRAKQTSTTTGTGTLTLIAPGSNLQSFTAAFGGSSIKVLYFISGASYWEVGIGTFDGASSLTRDTVLGSSSGGSLVSLPVGTHDVAAWEPAQWRTQVVTGTATLALADLFGQIVYTGAVGTLNMPAIATVPPGIMFPIFHRGSGDLTFDPSGAETVNGAATVIIKPGQAAWVGRRDAGTNEWLVLFGSLSNPAVLDVAQTFTAAQKIRIAGVNPLDLECTDAGAAAGPILRPFRDSASAAASDFIGAIDFDGRSSTGVQRTYARDGVQIVDPTNASEDAVRQFETMVAGARAVRSSIGAGLFMAGATGGDPGAGAVNATDFMIDGASIALQLLQMWVKFNGTGTVAINDSFNTAGLADNGTGNYTVTIANDFQDADYAFTFGANTTSVGNISTHGVQLRSTTDSVQLAGSIQVQTGNTSAGTATDASVVCIMASGPLA